MNSPERPGGDDGHYFIDWAEYFADREHFFDQHVVDEVEELLQKHKLENQEAYIKSLNTLAGMGLFEVWGQTYRPQKTLRAFGEWRVDPPAYIQLRDHTVESIDGRWSKANIGWASVNLYIVINAGQTTDGNTAYITLERDHEDPYPEIAYLNELELKLRAILKKDELLRRESKYEARFLNRLKELGD